MTKPYAKTTRDGHTIDQLTNFALYETEHRLGYTAGSLTVVQGSYNAGGVGASAGTHDGGGAVDLTPVEWEKKVRAARAAGFAAWHRTAIPGVWNEHIHMVLIGNDKLSPSAAAQVVDYKAKPPRDGLAGHNLDPTWHPDPIPTFAMPEVVKVPGRRVAHPKPGHPEYEGDSIRAIDAAADAGIEWIDLNALLSRDGEVVNTHYPLPLHHGFVDPLGQIHPDTPVSGMTVEQLGRLRTTKGGYRIHPMSDMLAHAHKRGVSVELDLKCHIGRGILGDLITRAPAGTKVQVKTMATRSGSPWEDLKPAHEAGLKTILLCHRPFLKVPEDAQLYIDYYRGFRPRWVKP